MEIVNPERITISEYYKGRNIFVTGGTGFLGKALIDKLLRSCLDIGNIYILIRPKKEKGIEERLKTLLNDKLFDTLKETAPHQISKIIPIQGDCAELNLDLSEADYQKITSSVSVIYHVAASVRFDDPLKTAILLNTRGTREVAQLALRTPGLSILVHVSTAYSNCVMGNVINEEFYPAPCDWRKTIKSAEELDNGLLTALTEKYLGPYPNTYTFTKALGEHVIKDMCEGKIPTIITRPSIVVSTIKDPVPGWIDNFNGPVGLLVACGKGLLRCSYQDPNINADYIPVDVTVKATIVASWKFGLLQQRDKVEVLNICNSSRKWMTLGEIVRQGRELSKEVPLNNSLWVPKGFVSASPVYAYMCTIFFHLLPAFFLDLGLKLAGQKMVLMKLQKKIYNAAYQLRYFTFQEWTFCSEKFLALEEQLLQEEKNVWEYEFLNEDVQTFLRNCMLGARIYLLKEPDDTLEKARIHYNRMYWLDKFTMTIFYGALFWLVIHLGLIDKTANIIYNYVMYYFEDL